MNILEIIRLLVTVYVGQHEVYVKHWREPPGFEARAQALEHAVVVAGDTFDLPPKLLLALAYTESGLNGNARGWRGVGMMQLNPRGRHGRYYVHSCPEGGTVCDTWNVMLGAQMLREAVDACGSVREGLGFYRSGRCVETSKTRYVLELWLWMEGR